MTCKIFNVCSKVMNRQLSLLHANMHYVCVLHAYFLLTFQNVVSFGGFSPDLIPDDLSLDHAWGSA